MSQPRDEWQWEVLMPLLKPSEDDDIALFAYDDPLTILVSLFGVAQSGKTATGLGFHHLQLISRHLSVAASAQVELVLFVLAAVVEDCQSKDSSCISTWSAWLVLWQVANTLERQWPSADVSGIRQAFRDGPGQGHPLLLQVASAMDAGTVEELCRQREAVIDNTSMFRCPKAAVLVVDLTRRTIRGAVASHVKIDPVLRIIRVGSLGDKDSVVMHPDRTQQQDVEWFVKVLLGIER
jgi:hypothetical protein